jgi:hypothetical protein
VPRFATIGENADGDYFYDHRFPTRIEKVQVGEKEVYRTPLLPGFELSVGRLLGVADSLEK